MNIFEVRSGGFPTKTIKSAFHVGTFNQSDKQNDSYEGSGLSISFVPDDWRKIARLSGEVWQLIKNPAGRFIDSHKMNDIQKLQIREWGISEGYLLPSVVYHVTFYDENEDEMYMEFSTMEEAMEEAMEPEDISEEISGLVSTPKMAKRLGWKVDNTALLLDLVLTFYAEDFGWDGVWWEDDYAPNQYSAPRGVIVKSMISSWEKHEVK